MPQVDPAHNITAILIGTGEFSFSEGAASAAAAKTAGYLDFGNVMAFTPAVEITVDEHFGSYRGTRVKDKTVSTQAKLDYQLKCDEWNANLLAILFGASSTTGHTQTVKSSVSADAWAFNTTASGTTKWYDVLVSGARVRNLSALTIATLTEGVEFVVDYLLGRVRFLVNQTAARTATISAPAITATDAGAFIGLTPFGDVIKQGYGRLTIYDQDDDNKVVLDHVDFSCEVRAESTGEVSGESPTEISLTVSVTADRGTVLVRHGNE